MNIKVISILPQIFESPLKSGVISRAIGSKILNLEFYNPRQFATDEYQSVDDRPFGGGDGMILKYENLKKAWDKANQEIKSHTVYLSPQGKLFNHKKAYELSKKENLILVCGRYGGIDQRFVNKCVDEEISIGDYVISGGELAALVVIDSVTRQLEGVLGNEDSNKLDSFCDGLLEVPQFTRPQSIDEMGVPEILLSGHHEKIENWRNVISYLITLKKRPELIDQLSIEKRKEILNKALKMDLNENDFFMFGFTKEDLTWLKYQ